LQEQIRLLKEKQETAEKIASRAFAQSYLGNLVPSVFETLVQNGYFYNKVEKEIESYFLPWLTTEVEKNMDKQTEARKVLDGKMEGFFENAYGFIRPHSSCSSPTTRATSVNGNIAFLKERIDMIIIMT
jgi:hypothetical protein